MEKTEVFGETLVPIPLSPPKISKWNILGLNPGLGGDILGTDAV